MREERIMNLIKSIPEIVSQGKLVMLIIDGLGSNKLSLPFLKMRVYRTVFPSSTPTFLYSLHSLLEPKRHGFLEWYMRFKGEPITIPPWKTISGKELKLREDINRREVFPFKSLSEKLYRKGFSSCYYTPFAESAFTRASGKRAKLVRIDYLSEVFPLDESDFTLIYWPSADSIIHKRLTDDGFRVEMKFLELFVRILWKRIERNTRLLVLSDHGLTEVRKRYKLPVIEEYPVGGSRVSFYRNVEKEEVEREIRRRRIKANVFELKELEEFKGNVSRRC